MTSVWSEGDTRVVVSGGGGTGAATALALADPGAGIRVLDLEEPPLPVRGPHAVGGPVRALAHGTVHELATSQRRAA